jgi:hypothetical protein
MYGMNSCTCRTDTSFIPAASWQPHEHHLSQALVVFVLLHGCSVLIDVPFVVAIQSLEIRESGRLCFDIILRI